MGKSKEQLTDELADLHVQIAAERQRLVVLGQVREEVWQMKNPEDFDRVLPSLRGGLEMLGIPFLHCGINVVDESGEAMLVRSHGMVIEGGWSTQALTDQDSIIVDIWREGKPVYRPDLDTEDPFDERERLATGYQSPIRSVLDVPFAQGNGREQR